MKPQLRRILPTLLPALAIAAAVLPASLPAQAITAPPPPITVTIPALDGFVDQVLAATGGVGVYADDSSSTGCMAADGRVVYRTDYLLMRSVLGDGALVAAVNGALAGLGAPGSATTIERIAVPGIVALPLVRVGLDGVPGDKVVPLARALVAAGHRAAPSYYFQPHGGPTYTWPSGRPDPIGGLPAARPATIGTGTSAVVFDTGMPSTAEANVPANMSKVTVGDVEVIDGDTDGLVDRKDSGHATAISGIIRLLAPGAKVQVARIAEPESGVITDLSAAKRMAQVLQAADAANAWPTVIVAAFGGPMCDVNAGVPGVQLQSMGLQTVAEAIAAKGKSVFVASAGNVGKDYPFYPAAFPGVVSVGAMDTSLDADGNSYTSAGRTGPRAGFSNYGTSVDLWAPGVALATYHVKGVRFGSDGSLISGAGKVDGTSYAAPVVAAEILDVVWRTGRSPVDALAALSASGVPCSAANGGGRAVALTSWTASPLTPAPAGAQVHC